MHVYVSAYSSFVCWPFATLQMVLKWPPLFIATSATNFACMRGFSFSSTHTHAPIPLVRHTTNDQVNTHLLTQYTSTIYHSFLSCFAVLWYWSVAAAHILFLSLARLLAHFLSRSLLCCHSSSFWFFCRRRRRRFHRMALSTVLCVIYIVEKFKSVELVMRLYWNVYVHIV